MGRCGWSWLLLAALTALTHSSSLTVAPAPNPLFWLKADVDSVSVRPERSLLFVTSWRDLSAHQLNFIQPYPDIQPVFDPNGLGPGQPSIRFDEGVSRKALTANNRRVAPTGDMSVFCRVLPLTGDAPIVSQGFVLGGSEYGWVLARGTDGWQNTYPNTIAWGSHDASYNANHEMWVKSAEGASPQNRVQILAARKQGREVQLFVDGELVAQETIGVAHIAYSTTYGQDFSIGRVEDPFYVSDALVGHIGEILAWDRALSDSEFFEVMRYLDKVFTSTPAPTLPALQPATMLSISHPDGQTTQVSASELVQAVAGAPSGSTVTLRRGLYREGCGLVVEGKNLTLTGEGSAGDTVVDCGNETRHVEARGSHLVLQRLTLANGWAGVEGGGCVRAMAGSRVELRGAVIRGCTTAGNGGGVAAEGSAVVLREAARVEECEAAGSGGCLELMDAEGQVWGSSVAVCTAGGFGGGASLRRSKLIVGEGGVVEGCVAGAGGAVAGREQSQVRLEGGAEVGGNTAGEVDWAQRCGAGSRSACGVAQASTADGGFAWLAVDGRGFTAAGRSADYAGQQLACSRTWAEAGQWWRVDLGQARAVQAVRVWGVAQDMESLQGFKVLVSSAANLSEATLCGESAAGASVGETVEAQCDGRGRFVWVLPGEAAGPTARLGLCEVQVLARVPGSTPVPWGEQWRGGGVYLAQSRLEAGTAALRGNLAKGSGGAVAAVNLSHVRLGGGVEVIGSEAAEGGGLFLELGSRLEAWGGVEVAENVVSGHGGAVLLVGGSEMRGEALRMTGNRAGSSAREERMGFRARGGVDWLSMCSGSRCEMSSSAAAVGAITLNGDGSDTATCVVNDLQQTGWVKIDLEEDRAIGELMIRLRPRGEEATFQVLVSEMDEQAAAATCHDEALLSSAEPMSREVELRVLQERAQFVADCSSLGGVTYGSKCFFAQDHEPASWFDASLACGLKGAHLAIVESWEENEIVNELGAAGSKWIGMSEDPLAIAGAQDGIYLLSDGSPPSYTNWADDEPNDQSGPLSEECVVMTADGTWNDVSCNSKYVGVCSMASPLGVSAHRPACEARGRFVWIVYENLDLCGVEVRSPFGLGGAVAAVDGSRVELGAGVEVQGGSATLGGGLLLLQSSLLLRSGVMVAGLWADFAGGAVFAAEGSELRMEGATIQDCMAEHEGGAVAAWKQSTVDALRVLLLSNRAGVRGGAVHSVNSTVSFSQSRLQGHNASAVVLKGARLHVAGNVSFEDNKGESGGAVWAMLKSQVFLSDGVEFARCNASEGGAAMLSGESHLAARSGVAFVECSAGDGGAIRAVGQSIVQLSDRVEVRACAAAGQGGGLLVEDGSVLYAEVAVLLVGCMGVDGAALLVRGGYVELSEGVDVVEGRATGDGTVHLEDSTLRGRSDISFRGCAAGRGGALFALRSQVWLRQRVELQGCSAKDGGAVWLSASSLQVEDGASCRESRAAQAGGCVYGEQESNMTLRRGVALVDCEAAIGGGVYLGGASRLAGADQVELTRCRADKGGGVVVSGGSEAWLSRGIVMRDCVGEEEGGGVWVSESTLQLSEGVEVEGCGSALGAGWAARGASAVEMTRVAIRGMRNAGAVLSAQGGVQVQMREVVAHNCSSAGDGGLLRGEGNVAVAVDGSRFEGIRCTGSGGVFYLRNASLAVNESNFTECRSGLHGGVISTTSVLTVERTRFDECAADGNAGAILAGRGVVASIRDAVFSEVRSRGDGGAVKADSGMQVARSSFFRCAATGRGGALRLSALQDEWAEGPSFVEVAGCSFVECIAGADGGAVSVTDGDLTVTGSYLAGNVAGSTGGGVSLSGAVLVAQQSGWVNNLARQGGALSVQEGRLEAAEVVLLGNEATGRGGGAVWVRDSASQLREVYARSNSAQHGGGGVVFWQGSEAPAVESYVGGLCGSHNATWEAQWEPCEAGRGGGAGALCELCAAGSFKARAGPEPCTRCAGGSTSARGSRAALACQCRAGSVREPGGDCVPCAAGSYWQAGEGDGEARCLDCPEGFFQEKSGQTGCESCAAGLTSPAGSAASSLCACRAGSHHQVCDEPSPCSAAYRGCTWQTDSGRTCQHWGSLVPHLHTFRPELYPEAGLHNNFCRNPDDDPSGPWCFTTDPEVRREYCTPWECTACSDGVRNFGEQAVDCGSLCDPCSNLCDARQVCDGADRGKYTYRGCRTHTVGGIECQAWAAQAPHGHTRTEINYPDTNLDSNFCRNPDGESNGPWCYTTDPSVRWDYCFAVDRTGSWVSACEADRSAFETPSLPAAKGSGPAAEAGQCRSCPANAYASAEQALCDQCPQFTASPPESTSIANCSCIAGYAGPAGGPCVPCAAGTYLPASGSTCEPCEPGTYQPQEAASSCVECPVQDATSPPGSVAISSCECRPGFRGRALHCQDGVQNGDEEQTDCGGSCEPCRVCRPEHDCDLSQYVEGAYYGCQSRTVTGHECQAWVAQTPHSHSFSSVDPYGGNYCRHSPGTRYLWCYTTDPSVRWEKCVAECNMNASVSDHCDDGVQNADEEGIDCGGSDVNASSFNVDSGGTTQSETPVGHCHPCMHAQNASQWCELCPENTHQCQCNAGYSGPHAGPCTQCSPGKFKDWLGSGMCVDCGMNSIQPGYGGSTCTTCPPSTSTTDGKTCVCDGLNAMRLNTSTNLAHTCTSPNSSNASICSAESSSEWYGVLAHVAVDGAGKDGQWSSMSCTHTATEDHPWWRVDLQSVRQIGLVRIWNRQDCCSGRLQEYKVLVSNSSDMLSGRACFEHDGSILDTFTGAVIDAPCDDLARFVWVLLPGTSRVLTLCEVEVYGNTCAPCPAGFWCPADDHTSSFACPRNMTSFPGSTGPEQCICAPGYTGPACLPCAAGTYKPEAGSAACVECLPGHFTAGPGAHHCTTCTEGTFGHGASCMPCPPSTHSPPGSAKVTNCSCLPGFPGPPGGPCTACSAGWVDSGHGTCELCPAGTYKENGPGECVQCPAFSTSDEGSTNAEACRCELGSERDGVNGSCVACPPNTFNADPTRGSRCSPCPPRSRSPAGSATPEACACTAGHEPAGGLPGCRPCPPGTSKVVDGLAACQECPMGSFAAREGSVECEPCGPGTFRSREQPGANCSYCHARSSPNANRSACLCHGGFERTPSGRCEACEPGLFSEGDWPCRPCSPGTVSNSAGQTTCSACVPGKYADAASSSCLDCPARSSSAAGSAAVSACLCDAGYSSADGVECSACPPGTFKAQGGSAWCTPCDAGEYAEAVAATACVWCAAGKFHQGGASAATCVECPAGSWSAARSAGQSDCLCNAGYTVRGDGCIACETGKFKAARGGGACEACPLHSTSQPGSSSVSNCVCNAGYVGAGRACVLCANATGCNEALYGSCEASTFAFFTVELPPLAYVGELFDVQVRKQDIYSQTVIDSVSTIQVFSSLPHSFDPDPAMAIVGSPTTPLVNGVARFTIGVAPTFTAWDMAAGSTDMLRDPHLRFEGVDVQDGGQMHSDILRVGVATGAGVCNAGYVLDLTETEHGFQGRCQRCPPGSYSLLPLQTLSTSKAVPECLTCPTGAECAGGGEVAFPVGDWEAADGIYLLRSCPEGHHMRTAQGHDLQLCEACENGEFIFASDDPASVCQVCPSGFVCPDGTHPTTEVRVYGAVLVRVGGGAFDFTNLTHFAALERAATQALRASVPPQHASGTSLFLLCASFDECRARPPSPRRESSSPELAVEFEVLAVAVSAEEVAGVLNGEEFLADLQQQLAVSGFSGELAVETREAPSSPLIDAEFEERGGDSPHLVLVACPPGYLLINFPVDFQRCQRCEALTYSLDFRDGCHEEGASLVCPEQRSCQKCPIGANCTGGDFFEPLVEGSEWVVEIVEAKGNWSTKRLASCPPGYILVRDEEPVRDQCIACPRDTYSVMKATYDPPVLHNTKAENATSLCRLCDEDAQCFGGNSLQPNAGFWLLPEDRAKVNESRIGADENYIELYRCQMSACEANNICRPGRKGPICAVCEEGYALSGNTCSPCGEIVGDHVKYSALGIFIVLALIVWYYAAWAPFFEAESEEEEETCLGSRQLGRMIAPVRSAIRRFIVQLVETNAIDYVKIVISFCQVVSTFEVTFAVDWPPELRSFWEYTSILRLEWARLPGVSCLAADLDYATMQKITVFGPLLVTAMLAAPSLVAKAIPTTSAGRHKRLQDAGWYSVMFWFFLSFPFLASSAVENFHCITIGGTRFLASDVTVVCPMDNKRSEVFVWAILSLILYPAGIPIFIYMVMRHYKVPLIARQKLDNAVLRAMLHKYQHLRSNTVVAKVATYVGGAGDSVLHRRAWEMFDGARGGKAEVQSIDLEMLLNFLAEIGIQGGSEAELQHLMESFDDDGNGMLEWEEFLVMVTELVQHAGTITGEEKLQDLTVERLDILLAIPWQQMLDEDEDEGSRLKRELKKSLKRTGTAAEPAPALQASASFTRAPSARSPTRSIRPPRISRAASRPSLGEASQAGTSLDSFSEHACPLPPDASLDDKIAYLLAQGKELLFRKAIAIPLLRCDGETELERLAMDRVGMLFDSYTLQHWWWENVEMARKFVMTSCVIFLYPGSPHQAAAGMFITNVFLLAFIAMTPFTSAVINRVQGVSLAAQATTLFCRPPPSHGLMLSVERLNPAAGEVEKRFLVYFVLFLNVTVFLLPFFAFLADPGKRRKTLQRAYRFHAMVASQLCPARGGKRDGASRTPNLAAEASRAPARPRQVAALDGASDIVVSSQVVVELELPKAAAHSSVSELDPGSGVCFPGESDATTSRSKSTEEGARTEQELSEGPRELQVDGTSASLDGVDVALQSEEAAGRDGSVNVGL